MQAARADVLAAIVHLIRDLGESTNAARLELELDSLGREQAAVLLGERRRRLGENPDEVVDAERVELDAYREPPLQLRDQVRRLRDAERARRDEQHVIGAYHAVARAHGAAL